MPFGINNEVRVVMIHKEVWDRRFTKSPIE